ncbi:4934_t:CDS:2, partial [Cetraspora pellucida]
PYNPRNLTYRNCDMITEQPKKNHLNAAIQNETMFDITLTCNANDTICNKVKIAFDTAAQIISSTFILNSRISLNASFNSFCNGVPNCPNAIVLGLAAPSSWILMQDDDNTQRLYPQALVKQFQFPTHPDYTNYDIFAMFNSDIQYWFASDPPIRPDQYDFLYVMLHELFHGLGFGSSWEEYLPGVVTPMPAINPLSSTKIDLYSSDPHSNDKVKFYEWAFDKHMIFINGTKTSSLTVQLNKFFSGRSGTLADFENNFDKSNQYSLAKNMYSISQTSKSLAFMPRGSTNPSDSLILETSFRPFRQGSSISHVDASTYTNTSDFLMRAQAKNGTTINILTRNFSDGSGIGPRLKKTMETMGYASLDNPNPYRPSIIDPRTLTSSSNTIKPYRLRLDI